MKRIWLLLLCALVCQPAWGNDSAVEARMLDIATELRCLVCQNESVAASRADFAVDIRELIRNQIKAGRSDTQIQDFLVARYGDFILYRPPLKATTLFLWLGPMLLMVGGLLVLAMTLRRRNRNAAPNPLDDGEQSMADALLRGNAHESHSKGHSS